MEMKTKQTKTQQQTMTARDVMRASYMIGGQSRTHAFKTAARAYKINSDGSISTRAELDYFK